MCSARKVGLMTVAGVTNIADAMTKHHSASELRGLLEPFAIEVVFGT